MGWPVGAAVSGTAAGNPCSARVPAGGLRGEDDGGSGVWTVEWRHSWSSPTRRQAPGGGVLLELPVLGLPWPAGLPTEVFPRHSVPAAPRHGKRIAHSSAQHQRVRNQLLDPAFDEFFSLSLKCHCE